MKVMKTCPGCSTSKPLEEFNKHRGRGDGYQAYCKLCSRAARMRHYTANHESEVRKRRDRTARYREDNRQFIYGFLMEHPCVDCGESDPIVLEFDHVDPSDKTESISELATWVSKPEMMLDEISKCQVRCANCHRRRTHSQFKWKCKVAPTG